MAEPETEVPAPPVARPLLTGWRKAVAALVLALFAVLGIGLAVLESPIGHRFVVDRIARYAPASGLRVTVGRFEGSLFGGATLRDVRLSDPQGLFMQVPVVDLDWRPLNWFTSGLDVRKLILHRGTLYRGPKLVPGDPNAPILPDFDIRIDRFELDRLTVSKGIMGEQRRVDLVARTDIRKGRVLLFTDARLGGQDQLTFKLDSEPKRDRFAVKLDYNAPKGGLIAGLIGAKETVTARVNGTGRYTDWRGRALVWQPGRNLADVALFNRAGRYGLSGFVHPAEFLSGLPARLAGRSVAVTGEGTLVSSVLSGRLGVGGQGATLGLNGTLDLARNAARMLKVNVTSRDPGLLGPGTQLEGLFVRAVVNGPFRRLAIDHRLTLRRLSSGTTAIEGVVQQGRLTRYEDRWALPLDLTFARAAVGNTTLDPRLRGGHLRGEVVLAGTRVHSENLVLGVPGLGAALSLVGDTRSGDYRLTGPVAARDLAFANLGHADADLRLDFRFGSQPWLLAADARGRMVRVTNPTLTTLAGNNIRFAGHVEVGGARQLVLRGVRVEASKLSLSLDGRAEPGGATSITGRGRHADYGPFTVEARFAADGPHAVLVFANPLPAAGLRDVRVALAPIPQGFRIETAGQSTLGPFTGTLGLFSPPGGPTRIEIQQLNVWKTSVTGTLVLRGSAASGTLRLAGGGVTGTIGLVPRGGGQGFDVALVAEDARFAGKTPIGVGMARINANGTLVGGHSTLTATVEAQGLQYGSLFVGRMNASAALRDGTGRVLAALTGRRGSRFTLQLVGDVSPGRYALLAGGDFAGQRISMPRRAVLTQSAEGWALAPTEVDYAGGKIIASGQLGARTRVSLALADMPLALIDAFGPDLGLGGKASGQIDLATERDGPPTGTARLEVRGLTRSGLVLTSRPIDLSLVGRLDAGGAEARAVVRDGTAVQGRLQGRIEGMPPDGALWDRLSAGRLFAQLRWSGPADALWRLAAVETFDLTGPVDVAADATGSLADPVIQGSIASSALRLQSPLTGTDVRNIAVRGTFAGSRLQLTSFAGTARNGGAVSGSGTIDLSNMGAGRGPALDLRLAARGAELLSRDDMAATVTGPLRVVSDGVGGTIAGRVFVTEARWNLGRASASTELPNVKTREINLPYDVGPAMAPAAPWRYLIDARASSHVDVRGLGLDSEWSADVRLRGTTAAPQIFGRADMVRGSYDFAGKRFELTRGQIHFDGDSPPDPRLDIAATADLTGLTATVTVTGTASKPSIVFTSVPSLPEEELLARLLFGSSITQISAPEAVQIGAALAALRGGGGLDPINKLRTAIGLDRLRIIGADAALGRGTSVAVGKYIGRRLYAEIVTDGRGYNATQLEYRVTRWLSILATVSSIGRQGIDAKISKDY